MLSRMGVRLICVDDERSALINCKSAIENFPNIESANFFKTAAEAIAYVRVHPIDIAFLDIDLPEMSGFELAEQLKSLCPTMEIAFVTGNISYMRVANRKIKAPYIFKPYADSDITDVLEGIKNLRRRVELMANGTVVVESEPGKGTTVTLTFPDEI